MKTLIILLTSLVFATTAFAIDIDSATGTSLGGGIFKTSKSVIVSFIATPTAYSAGSKHLQGTKGYIAISSDPIISTIACAAGTDKVTISSATAAGTTCSSPAG